MYSFVRCILLTKLCECGYLSRNIDARDREKRASENIEPVMIEFHKKHFLNLKCHIQFIFTQSIQQTTWLQLCHPSIECTFSISDFNPAASLGLEFAPEFGHFSYTFRKMSEKFERFENSEDCYHSLCLSENRTNETAQSAVKIEWMVHSENQNHRFSCYCRQFDSFLRTQVGPKSR